MDNTTLTIVTLIFGAMQGLLALFMYMGWDKKFMTAKLARALDKRTKLVPVLIFGGLFFSGIGLYRTFTTACGTPLRFSSAKIVEVRDRVFVNERVVLDGHKYTNCTFTNCTFIYNGTGPLDFSHNKIIGSYLIDTEGDPVAHTVALMKGFGATRPDFPIIGPDHEPVKTIAPPNRQPPQR